MLSVFRENDKGESPGFSKRMTDRPLRVTIPEGKHERSRRFTFLFQMIQMMWERDWTLCRDTVG